MRAAVYLALSLIVIGNVFANVPQYRKYLSTITGDEALINREIYNFMDGLNREASGNVNFLVINQPDFYYYSGARGYTYKDNYFTGVRGLYTEEGILDIFTGRSVEETFGLLKDKYNIQYVFINERRRKTFHEINDIITHGCTLAFTDESSLSVYRLGNYFNPLDGIEDMEPVFTDDFSAWTGLPVRMTASEYREFDFPLTVSGIRGEFMISMHDDEKRFLSIAPADGSRETERVLQFTYDFAVGEGAVICPEAGDILVLTVAIRKFSPPSRRRRKDGVAGKLAIFVQDLSGDWRRESNDAVIGGEWERVSVYKYVRESTSRIIAGIYWVPESPDEYIEIREPSFHIIPPEYQR